MLSVELSRTREQFAKPSHKVAAPAPNLLQVDAFDGEEHIFNDRFASRDCSSLDAKMMIKYPITRVILAREVFPPFLITRQMVRFT